MKNYFKINTGFILILFFLMALLFISCNDPDDNTAPRIVSFTADDYSIYYNSTTTLNINAVDDDNDNLNYSYQITTYSVYGWISNDMGNITGTEPNLIYDPISYDRSAGSNIIQATVSDGNGGVAVSNIVIDVFCFVAGTKISTPNGLVNIEDIKTSDVVYGYNLDNKTTSGLKILKTFQHTANKIYTIEVDDVKIGATAEHPFYVFDKGWTKVQDLKIGDLLVTKSGTTSAIKSIKMEKKLIDVYNIRVDKEHTYFITSNEYLVHNK